MSFIICEGKNKIIWKKSNLKVKGLWDLTSFPDDLRNSALLGPESLPYIRERGS